MTEKEAWERLLEQCPCLEQYGRYYYCGSSPGLCGLVHELYWSGQISLVIHCSMINTIALARKRHNAPFPYKWNRDKRGWNQRRAFCRKQIRRLSKAQVVSHDD